MDERIDSRGVFITFEGPDGAGKSLQARRLADRITELGHEVVVTREPGGTQLGERIRDLLLSSTEGHGGLSDAFLFNAARAALVAQVVEPALARDATVVCDRFADSTLAYQGYGDGLPLENLRRLAFVATGGRVPHRTVLLDVPVEVGLARRHGGSAGDLTRFETSAAHGVAFHERVRAGFLEMAEKDPERWRRVDAGQGADAVAEAIWQELGDLFAEKGAG